MPGIKPLTVILKPSTTTLASSTIPPLASLTTTLEALTPVQFLPLATKTTSLS